MKSSDILIWRKYYKYKNLFLPIKKFINSLFSKELKDILSNYLIHDKNIHLIEIGCGNSDWLPYFNLNFGYSVAGLDYEEHACELAEEKLKKKGVLNYKIYCGDFFEYYQKIDQKYDILISFGVVEHFENPSEIIRIFTQYMKADSLIITVCPNTKGIAMKLQKYIDKRIYNFHKKFSLEDLIKFHVDNNIEEIFSGYIEYMSFNNLDFVNYGIVGLFLKAIIKVLNAPIVYIFYIIKKFFRFNINDRYFSGSMIFIGRVKNISFSSIISGSNV